AEPGQVVPAWRAALPWLLPAVGTGAQPGSRDDQGVHGNVTPGHTSARIRSASVARRSSRASSVFSSSRGIPQTSAHNWRNSSVSLEGGGSGGGIVGISRGPD